MAHAFAGEHLSVLDSIQWTHTDNGHGDGRRIVLEAMKFEEWAYARTDKVTATPLVNLAHVLYPSKKQMTAKADEYFLNTIAVARMRPTERRNSTWNESAFTATLTWRYELIGELLPAMSRAMISADEIAADLAGARVMVAIERYRADNAGAPPQTLAALVPTYLPALPDDPYAPAGVTFGYQVLTSKDERGRVYLLYSYGANLKDDSASATDDPNITGRAAGARPADLIINRTP
jgi:hypothetical protein